MRCGMMWLDGLQQQVTDIVKPLIEEKGADLVELHIFRHGRILNIQVVVDLPDGGITIGLCGQINRDIDRALEGSSIFEGEYVVEVASPGLDRPLRTEKDFRRVIGRSIRFHLSEHILNKKEHWGKLAGVEENQLIVETKEGVILIPLTVIQKAVQII